MIGLLDKATAYHGRKIKRHATREMFSVVSEPPGGTCYRYNVRPTGRYGCVIEASVIQDYPKSVTDEQILALLDDPADENLRYLATEKHCNPHALAEVVAGIQEVKQMAADVLVKTGTDMCMRASSGRRGEGED